MAEAQGESSDTQTVEKAEDHIQEPDGSEQDSEVWLWGEKTVKRGKRKAGMVPNGYYSGY